jgi:hypothetical protein
MNIIPLDRNKIRAVASASRWPPHTVKTVNQIIKTWLVESDDITVILYFKNNKKEIHAYMPLISYKILKKEKEVPFVKDIECKEQGVAIIGIDYLPIFGARSDNMVINTIINLGRNTGWNSEEIFELI